jgi:hypothetical protein
MPADEVVRRIEATAVSPSGGRDDRTGAGIVDPYLAVTAEAADAAVAPPAGETPGGAIRVAPVPQVPPLLTPGEATAAAVAAILLGCAAVATVAGLSARRIAARRERRGRDGPAYRPVGAVPGRRLG